MSCAMSVRSCAASCSPASSVAQDVGHDIQWSLKLSVLCMSRTGMDVDAIQRALPCAWFCFDEGFALLRRKCQHHVLVCRHRFGMQG